VDLQREHMITWTATQGRFGNGVGREYTETFLLEYWRPGLPSWVTYKDHKGENVSQIFGASLLVRFSVGIGLKDEREGFQPNGTQSN